jgi:hypothetical protein
MRFDRFGTKGNQAGTDLKSDERGIAGTAAITWMPRKGIGLIGEFLAIDYNRPLRVIFGQPAHATEMQAQIALRISF